ncbi:MAG TPA: type IV pilus twitching motility protein PilT [Longimicrobiaceae bacterium]|nr:type IV pilus twitching motility protein PilT [Longimicrobiaceae bacterium]
MQWEDPAQAPTPLPIAKAGEREFSLRAALESVVRRGASDLHLKAGRPPMLRIDGELRPMELPPLRHEDLKRAAEQILTPRQREHFERQKELDFSVGVQGLGRFRVTAFQQRGSPGLALRAIPTEIPTLEQLQLPKALQTVALARRGLVLVTGITGSGKSTTLAAMIRHVNEHRPVNVVTIEDPIEFVHRDIRALINQREVGTDTLSFQLALRNVLRQDPDVILLGEIRDQESMEALLKAANTGHTVFSTMHTLNAAQTIGRIISFFPPHQHEEIRALLAEALQAVISMRLIPRSDQEGRVAAVEVMINTAAISDRIRHADQEHTIPDLIAEGRTQYGMQTFDQSVMDLYRQGVISYESAVSNASNPAEFALRASGVQAASDATWTGTGIERMGS